MATNKPTGDNRRIGAVKKRTQLKTKLMGTTAWTKRNKNSGRFMDVKKSKKKFKGVRSERGAKKPARKNAKPFNISLAFHTCREGWKMFRSATAAALVLASCLLAGAQQNPSTQVSGQTSLWRVSKLVGVPVYNTNEQIGEINDLLMDHEGQVSHIVISISGSGGRLVPIKLDVVRFPHRLEPGTLPGDRVNERWYPEQAVLATSKEALLNLPEFRY